MSETISRAHGRESTVRAFVEYAFARQKGPMRLVVRTIGLARGTVKIGLANLAYKRNWAIWLMEMPVTA